MGLLPKQPAGQGFKAMLVETPFHLQHQARPWLPGLLWEHQAELSLVEINSGRSREGREEQLCSVSVSSHPSAGVKTREFMGKAWRNICKEFWHLCPYMAVWPGQEGMSSAVKRE